MPRTKREEKNTPKSIQVCELARKKDEQFYIRTIKNDMVWVEIIWTTLSPIIKLYLP